MQYLASNRWLRFVLALFTLAAGGCAEVAHRPYVNATTPRVQAECGASALPPAVDTTKVTPEISTTPPYTLHFLEFDDQGWPYRPAKAAPWQAGAGMGDQVDCAMADLAQTVETHDVRVFVYVHGWHHSARDDDRDLKRFRALLKEQASMPGNQRRVIGFYIGWNGKTISAPLLKDTNFWGRKNAAHHVSEGTIREFFARIKALRDHYNNRQNKARSANCGSDPDSGLAEGKPCPIRTVMIGHSFGAWILYSATSPYILETLAASTDLPADTRIASNARERGIADLIVLLNPAFEGSRYEAVHRAASRYEAAHYEPPLLVSLTSTADLATRKAFPIARFFNSLFQYPATSDAESEAMKHTHGHIDRYLTHQLTVDTARMSSIEGGPMACKDKDGTTSDTVKMRAKFITDSVDSLGRLKLPAKWTREMCGGLKLSSLATEGSQPTGIVWNVRTFKDVIPDHNSITTLPVRDFIEQLYGDVSAMPKLKFAP